MVLDVKSDGKIKKGENKAVAECLGLEKDIVITGYEATDFVTSLEPVDIEDDLYMVEYYNGYYMGSSDGINAKVIINYADGAQETVDFNDGYTKIVISDSRQYPAEINYNSEHRDADLLLAGCKYESYKIDIVLKRNNITLAILKFCSIISSNLNWRKSVCSLSLFDADEDSLYLVLGTGLNCYVPDRVIEISLPLILLLMAYSY